MKTGKLITFQIIAFLAAINMFFVYVSGGFSSIEPTTRYITNISIVIFNYMTLFSVIMLVSLSYVVLKAITKKNLLRVSLLILAIQLVVSMILRAIEFAQGTFDIFAILQTIFYLVLLILNISILKDLFKIIQTLFLQTKK